jgi:hypothetical protein
MHGTCFVILVAALALGGTPAGAGRCGSQHPPQCGPDDQTEPPTVSGGAGGCTDASIAASPLFRGSNACRPGETKVIYDIGPAFPNNGQSGDAPVAGLTPFVTLRAGDSAPCAHMVDTVDPKPNAVDPQPEGARKVPLTGYVIGCWTAPDHEGCRDVRFHTEAVCLHIGHELLGSGCTNDGDLDCSAVSTEQIAIDVPGGQNHKMCPPTDPDTSCRGTRPAGDPGFRFRLGGFCATDNCATPGVAPDVDPERSCTATWGATNLGYNRPPGKGINEPGWYDWKTGAFKLDLSSPKGSCGDLGRCIGERTNTYWDLRVIGVPRMGQQVPCAGDVPCDAGTCF